MYVSLTLFFHYRTRSLFFVILPHIQKHSKTGFNLEPSVLSYNRLYLFLCRPMEYLSFDVKLLEYLTSTGLNRTILPATIVKRNGQ